MAGAGVQVQAVDALELDDAAARLLAERSLALEGMEHDAFEQVAEGEVNLNGQWLKPGDAAALSGESTVNLSANGPAQVLLFDLN